MRVLMTGGGTSGHVNPAIAIAEAIKLNFPDSEIAFVGTPRGIENKTVPAAGYKLYHVDVRGIKRSLSPANIRAAYLALTSPYRAKKLIREFKPDIVIGTGGYVSWPVCKAATMMGVPCMLHEANAYPGVAVRMLAGSVDKVLLNFEKSAEYLKCPKEKLVTVGNPLRNGFSPPADIKEAKKAIGAEGYEKMILSYGGSLGAKYVNEAVLYMMREYTKAHPEILHVHAVGAAGYEEAKRIYDEYGLTDAENIRLCEYIYDMPAQMAAADLLICRAGAMTISEVAMMEKPTVFIPSPNVTENHQYKNARVLEEKGAAMIIEEKDLDGERLIKVASELLSNDEARVEMGRKAGEFAVTDAKKLIIEEIRKLVK